MVKVDVVKYCYVLSFQLIVTQYFRMQKKQLAVSRSSIIYFA